MVIPLIFVMKKVTQNRHFSVCISCVHGNARIKQNDGTLYPLSYLQADTLKDLGISHFDEWAADFGEVIRD